MGRWVLGAGWGQARKEEGRSHEGHPWAFGLVAIAGKAPGSFIQGSRGGPGAVGQSPGFEEEPGGSALAGRGEQRDSRPFSLSGHRLPLLLRQLVQRPGPQFPYAENEADGSRGGDRGDRPTLSTAPGPRVCSPHEQLSLFCLHFAVETRKHQSDSSPGSERYLPLATEELWRLGPGPPDLSLLGNSLSLALLLSHRVPGEVVGVCLSVFVGFSSL